VVALCAPIPARIRDGQLGRRLARARWFACRPMVRYGHQRDEVSVNRGWMCAPGYRIDEDFGREGPREPESRPVGSPRAHPGVERRGTVQNAATGETPFIEPEHQGRGIGAELLARAAIRAPARRLTITDAIQPVSHALDARAGTLPATPILAFAGERRVASAPSLETAPPDPSAIVAIDAAAYGFDRSVDHAYWATEAVPTLWLRRGARSRTPTAGPVDASVRSPARTRRAPARR
jgi:GNAT superfamily N-acetyltransferase